MAIVKGSRDLKNTLKLIFKGQEKPEGGDKKLRLRVSI